MNADCIVLTPKEMLIAGVVGLMRQNENFAKGVRLDRVDKPVWHEMIEGAMAELGFSLWRRAPWTAIGTKWVCDVGNEDVRVTRNHGNCLIIKQRDADDRNYWLLTGEYGRYVVRGYIYGKDGKQQRFWREGKEGRPCYYVPQSELLFEWPEHLVNEQTKVQELSELLETESDYSALCGLVLADMPRSLSAARLAEDQTAAAGEN